MQVYPQIVGKLFVLPHINTGIRRLIFTQEQLTINRYVYRRQLVVRASSPTMIEAQKDALRKILKREPTHAHVFTSQFPSFLYTIENTAQDMEMLILAVEKLESTKYRDVDKPGLGLIVMRALYYLQNDTIAQQLYQELREAEFFKRTRSQLIYFDLLYDKEEFGQIIADAKLHIDLIHERGQKLSRAICLQMFAACYKENTNQSFDVAMHIHNKYMEKAESRDYLIYLAALALKQQVPHIAQQYLSETWPIQRSAIPNLRLKAALQSGQPADAIDVLTSALDVYGDFYNKLFFSAEVIENAESFFEQCTAEHLRLNFQAVVNQLKSDKYIIDSSLDRLLLDISYSDDSHDRAIAYNRRIFKNRKT